MSHLEWRRHNAHLVHPSPVRAHSYPLALYPSSSSNTQPPLWQSIDEDEPAPTRPPLLHANTTSTVHSVSPRTSIALAQGHPVHIHTNGHAHPYPYHSPQSPASVAHSLPHLPSPPSSTMADPWGEREADDAAIDAVHAVKMEMPDPVRWAGIPPAVLPSGGARQSAPTTPNIHPAHISPAKRPLSPMSRRLLAPVTLEVWAALLDKSKGRDKKTVQYSLRTYLYVLGLVAAVRPLTKWFTANRKRTQQAVAGLSLTRKCLLLLNPLRPAGALLSPEPTSARAFLAHLIELASTIADDIFCLSRLGLVARRKGIKADRWANRIWFMNTLLGLWALHVKSYRRLDEGEKERDKWQWRKYIVDLVFVSYDIFGLTRAKEPVQCIAGLSAALISTGQIYDKEWTALAKR